MVHNIFMKAKEFDKIANREQTWVPMRNNTNVKPHDLIIIHKKESKFRSLILSDVARAEVHRVTFTSTYNRILRKSVKKNMVAHIELVHYERRCENG